MVLSMERWKGKVAVVTGASAGIGEAICEALVDAGLQVAGIARRVDKVRELSDRLRGKPGQLHAFKADITSEKEVVEVFQTISNTLGPIHILINSAGLAQATTLVGGDADKWRKVLDTNVFGLCVATREAVEDMRRSGVDGHVVHINSVLGHQVLQVPNFNVYPASKFAVTALTETLRRELLELGSRIKITSVSPGPVETEFAEASKLLANQEFKGVYTTLPKLTAEDVADAVVYALSTPPHVQVQEVMVRPLGEFV